MKTTLLHTLILLAGRLLTRGAQIISFMILARALSPDAFGVYGVLTSLVFLTGQLGHFGLRQAGAVMIGQKKLTDGEVAGTFFSVWPLLVVISGLGLWLFGGLDQTSDPWIVVAIIVALAGVLALTLAQGVFLGRGQTKLFAIADTGPRVLLTLLTVAVWLLGWLNADTAFWIFAVSFVGFAPYTIYLMLKGVQTIRPAYGKLPEMVRYGILYAISAAVILLQGRVGLFFLAQTSSTEDAGQFFAAQRASEIFLELATAAGLVLFSETARSTDKNVTIRNALKTASILFGLFLVGGLIAVNFTPLLVRVLLGTQYANAASVLSILLLGLGPAAAVRILNSMIAGMGRPYISALVVICGIAVNVLACVLLVPVRGIEGAAIALVLGQTSAALIYFAISIKLWRGSRQI